MQYVPTVYERLVTDYLAEKDIKYANYKEEFEFRRHSQNDFKMFYLYLKYIVDIARYYDWDFKEAKQALWSEDDLSDKIPVFKFTGQEKNVMLYGETIGTSKSGSTLRYKDFYGNKIVVTHDYLDLPENIDAFVVFGGHRETGNHAVEAWLADLKKTGVPKKIIFLGLHDNQGHTNFSDMSLKYNTVSEAEMYRRVFLAFGVPKEIVDECFEPVTDISTAENIEVLAKILNKHFKNYEEVNLAMVTYTAYENRVKAEFSFAFSKMGKKVPSTNFIIAHIPPKKREKDRITSYDNLNTMGGDLIIGNCASHIYREFGKVRFKLPELGEYPSVFKPILPIVLGYSYPNIANEMSGTDMKVAIILKLIRDVMIRQYGWECDAAAADKEIEDSIEKLRNNLIFKGLIKVIS